MGGPGGRSPDPDVKRRGQVPSLFGRRRDGLEQDGRIQTPLDYKEKKKVPAPAPGVVGRVSLTPPPPVKVHPSPTPQLGGRGLLTANEGWPCAIASSHANQPKAAPGCTCPGFKGPRVKGSLSGLVGRTHDEGDSVRLTVLVFI